ncbi:MAG TPA: NAD(P)-dependent oxidoreductase [Streptosporangiaceae bacterium]|jgi:3-hydroxyisobutyrate dehydrogenase-like beta-hydroxyacid dehydrogenase
MAERPHGKAGWLGTGRMGTVLVRRLLAAGLDVSVYNRTRARAEPLAADGAHLVGRASDLAAARVVFVTVGTSEDLLDALLGAAGLMSGAHAPGIVIDLSTVSVEASGQVRQELARRGTQFLAAPVSGNPRVAAAGRLTFAVSGSPDAAAEAEAYLDILGAGASYVGAGEIARTVKLCHNLLLGVVTQSLAEVTVLAEKAGVSRQAFLACINDSVLGSTFTRYKSPALVNLDFHPTFTAELLRKDFDLGLAAARENEVPMPVAALVHQIVQGLVGQGYGQQDFATLIEVQARSAGLELASENAFVPDGLQPVADGAVTPATAPATN